MVRGCRAFPIMMEERQAREASMVRTLQRRSGGGGGEGLSTPSLSDM